MKKKIIFFSLVFIGLLTSCGSEIENVKKKYPKSEIYTIENTPFKFIVNDTVNHVIRYVCCDNLFDSEIGQDYIIFKTK
jgi:hypothetical protein